MSDGWAEIDENTPRDGTVIELTAFDDDGSIYMIVPMQWGHIKRNGLFPGKTGMWMTTDGSMTWNDHPTLGGGPTHWRNVQ